MSARKPVETAHEVQRAAAQRKLTKQALARACGLLCDIINDEPYTMRDLETVRDECDRAWKRL